VSTTPAAGATDVPVTSVPTATFGEPLVAESLQVTVTGPDGAVPATAELDAAGTTVTVRPTGGLPAGATVTVAVRGADLAGNTTADPFTWSFGTAAAEPVCPCSFATATDAPPETTTEAAAAELGLRFTATAGGWVTAIRYRAPGAVDAPRLGSLWAADGSRLATVVLPTATAAGWVEAPLAEPVPLTAGSTYVVSYALPTGATSAWSAVPVGPRAAGPLTADDGAVRGAAGVLPVTAATGQDLGADLVVVTTEPDGVDEDGTAPVVTAGEVAPAGAGRQGVVTFSEPVEGVAATVTVPGGGSVPLELGATAADLTVRLTIPDGVPAGTYVVTVTRARDGSGNQLAAPWTWSATFGS
jgi:hypothetical protein